MSGRPSGRRCDLSMGCRLGNLFETVEGSMLQEPTWQFSGEHASPLN